MPGAVGRAIRRTTTGTLHPSPGGGVCFGCRLAGGADAATATVRENGSGGSILFVLKAGIEAVDKDSLSIPFHFQGELHVTITGTTPEFTAFV